MSDQTTLTPMPAWEKVKFERMLQLSKTHVFTLEAAIDIVQLVRDCIAAHESEVVTPIRERFKSMSTVEMMGENENVRQHVTEWEERCLKAETENAALKEELKKWRGQAEDNHDRLVKAHSVCTEEPMKLLIEILNC